jgi:hypothetical protein
MTDQQPVPTHGEPHGAPPPPPPFPAQSTGMPAYPPPPPYPAPGWTGHAPQPQWTQQSKTNGMAIASLVLGLLWIWAIGSVLAIIFGHIAMGQIDQSGGLQSGRGMALAGTILGYVGTGFTVLLLMVVVAGF